MTLPPFPAGAAIVTDRIAARLRTLWPMLIGHVAALAVVHGAPVLDVVETATGYRPTATSVTLLVGLVAGYGIYEGGRWLEARRGPGRLAQAARGAGRFLLSLGVPTGTPTYQR